MWRLRHHIIESIRLGFLKMGKEMGGQKTGSTNYTTHIVVFLLLTVFMYVFAFVLVDHSRDVPARVDTVHADKQE